MKRSRLQSWDETSPPPQRWWAFYVRVTREESLKKDLSIPNQCARARELAAARGWTDYQIYVEEKNVSAEEWTDKRPAFRLLLDDVASGRVLGVCARHTDRLWRGNEIQGRFLRVLRVQGVELWDFNSRYDYKSAHGRFSLQVLGAASELEVGLIAERIREMKRGKALKGKTGGGPPPYGYTSQSHRIVQLRAAGLSDEEAYRQACTEFPIGKCWHINEEEAQVVRLVFELYTEPRYRYGCKRIARHLNQHGYRPRSASAFSNGCIARMINNPVYAGFTTYDDVAYENRTPSRLPRCKQTLYKAEHPTIVSPELWRAAQEIKATESKISRMRTARDGSTTESFSLTGIFVCPSCGAGLNGKWTHRTAKDAYGYRYYMCGRRYNGGREACTFPAIPAKGLQEAVWKWVHEIVSRPEFVMEHVERLQKKLQAEQPDMQRQIAALRRRRDSLKASIEKYFRAFESSHGSEPDTTVLDRVRELRGELQTVEAELVPLEARSAPATRKVSPDRVKRYLAKLRKTVEERAEYQRALFQEFKREHDFQVRVSATGDEFTASLALPSAELLAEEKGARGGKIVASVLKIPAEKMDRHIVREVSGSSAPAT